MNARETEAVTQFEMISPVEANVRIFVGYSMLAATGALFLTKGADFLGAGPWCLSTGPYTEPTQFIATESHHTNPIHTPNAHQLEIIVNPYPRITLF